LTASTYFTLSGGADSALLAATAMDLNMRVISDTLTSATYFIDSLIANQTFRDSITNVVFNNNNATDSLVTNIINNSLISNYLGIDTNVFNAVANNGKALTSDKFITINGGDSLAKAVLADANLAVNIKAVSDTLTKAPYFIDSLISTTNNNFVDTMKQILNAPSLVRKSADYTFTTQDVTVIFGSSASTGTATANVTFTLPTSAVNGKLYRIVNATSTYDITLAGGTVYTLDGSPITKLPHAIMSSNGLAVDNTITVQWDDSVGGWVQTGR